MIAKEPAAKKVTGELYRRVFYIHMTDINTIYSRMCQLLCK